MFLSKREEQLAQELSCPICLQLFSDPVVLPCGHNYCRACICKTANIADISSKILLRCPECREEYQDMDSLQRNFKLCNIIEGYRATAPPLDMQPEAESDMTTVLCDHCIDNQSQAVKTCLVCEVSLCSGHLQKHHEKKSFRAHTVVDPLNEVVTKSCAIHRRPLEYFCSNDMTSLCSTCFIEGHHQDHDVLTFSVAEEEMRRALESRNKVVSSKLQLTESLLQKTTEEQGASEAVGEKMVNKAVSVMESMAALVDRFRERLCTLLEEERMCQRKSWQLGVSSLEELHQQLLEAQKGTAEALNEKDTHVFIHRFMKIEHKLKEVVTASIPSNIPSKVPLNINSLQTGLKTQDFRSEMTRLLDSLHILLNPLELTFNVYTAHPSLIISTDMHTIKYSSAKQSYVDHPERFTTAPQVLCSQGFSGGEHVWVVEVGTSCMWSVGVCYKSIPRRGDHSRLGHNSGSWRLQWKNGKLTVCTSSSSVALGEMAHYMIKIEIALDFEGGTLTFHGIKGRREHLYTFRTVFKESVYPAFSIHSNTPESWITLHSGM
ncbi:E3 ubiquitin/ISG15 ligase TRIM25-like [Melanotaenia boesemani]|uniref:E3 ubiquitin/ISG15 ligase TRIM25-like n=1 Tax=Melanotaenia boesemani TaxID=1250792 RepID=UPI001C03DB9B|nr:E3 ubiquitin/ISG15 ligase TRIM25-like [Melanotaenia boesemani]